MNKIVKNSFIILLLMMLITPLSAQAFSWKNIFSWGKQSEVIPEQVVELNQNQKSIAQQKLNTWVRAYKGEGLSLLISQPDSLNITEAELNYILQARLEIMKNPPVKDIQASLTDDKFIIDGYALIPWEGKIHLEVAVNVLEDQLYFYVQKARYKGFYVPGFLVGRLLYKELESVSDFFFSDQDVKLQDISIQDGVLNLTIN